MFYREQTRTKVNHAKCVHRNGTFTHLVELSHNLMIIFKTVQCH